MSKGKTKNYSSTCSYCGTGCGIVIEKDSFNNIKVEGDENHPVNRGTLCSKGRALHYTVMDKSDRLMHPMMRWNREGQMVRVSWDTAMERAAKVFTTFIDKHGPDSVAFYVSGQLLTEEYYLANKLVKGFLGTNNIDTNSRLCMSSAVVGYKKVLGEDAVPVSYADIELADTFLIAGANPAWCHPIIFRRLEKHKEENPNVRVVVVDPRKTQSCSIADLHLQIKPGTDIYLYKAIGRILIENEKVDYNFITNHTDGFEDYKEGIYDNTLEETAEICGVSVDDIELAADYIGDAKGFITMWTMGLNQSSIGVNKNINLLALSVITGQIGKPGAGPFSLTGQPNAMGGREVGGLSNMLAAHREYTNPTHRKEVATYWGVNSVSDRVGTTATAMMEKLNSGELKAIWVICTNPLVSWPNAREADRALKNAKFVIVQDVSTKSDTLKYADLALPAAGFMEKEGTMTNSERRITHLSKVLDAPGEALPDTEILIRFAQKMGFGHAFNYASTEEIYNEHKGLTAGTNLDVTGVTYNLLREKKSIQWPFSEGASKGTTRLFTDNKFFTDNGKAKLYNTPSSHDSEKLSDDYPLILTTGRIRDQWHTMTRTGKVEKLNQHISKPFLEIHPDDAKARNIKEGDILIIKNGRGEVQVPAKVTTDIKAGVVFLPMHWGRVLNNDLNRANNLTSLTVDPTSKQPDFKYSAVQVEKFVKPKQKVCIVGAGAAAFQFIKSYRERNDIDEIMVFSKESTPFYNRVMLPDYISGEKDWKHLLKYDEEAGDVLNCTIVTGVAIDAIDRKSKTIRDSKGESYKYDILILATGSGAFKPPIIPPEMDGIYTLRSRSDAEKIRQKAADKKNVVVVGGGILGIELADSLNTIGVNVTVIQRSSRLMERQLDEMSSQLLDIELKDRDINIIYNDELRDFVGTDNLEAIKLKSGRTISCGALVFAIGTRPRVELARAAGVDCGRGVVVNEFFQSSDKSIFAIGEIAEFKKQLFGITAAAEEQASLLSQYLLGDTSSPYEGSLLMNILKVEGLNLCSAGMVEVPKDDKGYEQILLMDLSQRTYKKCIVYKDKLVGCVLVGSKDEFLEFRDLIRNKVELGDKRTELLQGSGAKKEVKGKLICSCNSVGEGNLLEEIKNGCSDLTSLCNNTGAGTGCGSCKPEVKAILEENLIVEMPAIEPLVASN